MQSEKAIKPAHVTAMSFAPNTTQATGQATLFLRGPLSPLRALVIFSNNLSNISALCPLPWLRFRRLLGMEAIPVGWRDDVL
jgi:hypothetical protein